MPMLNPGYVILIAVLCMILVCADTLPVTPTIRQEPQFFVKAVLSTSPLLQRRHSEFASGMARIQVFAVLLVALALATTPARAGESRL